MRRIIFGTAAFVATTALVVACSIGTDCDFGLCAGPPVGFEGGEGGLDALPDALPNECENPDSKAGCLDENAGVFVSPKGVQGAPGTKLAPVRTFADALALAAKNGKNRIYACGGDYPENVTLSTPINILGGWSCDDWTFAKQRAVITAATRVPALRIERVTQLTAIQDVEFVALEGDDGAPTSVAAFVLASRDITFRRTKFLAKNGTVGRAGAIGLQGVADKTLEGLKAQGTAGGLAKTCKCTIGGDSIGGAGGASGVDGTPGETAQTVPEPVTATGEGGRVADCQVGTGNYVNGRAGSNAPNAKNGPAISVAGRLTPAGWMGTVGKNGDDAVAGQGGGGGAGLGGGGGGGGGCGGCGGGGGKGGAAGGGSIGIVLVDSPNVAFAQSEIQVAQAGDGGPGGTGAQGVTGGPRGAPGDVGTGCPGGGGGRGGNGGHGGGGAGGPAVGVLFSGARPQVEALFTAGLAGNGGRGPGSPGPKGPEGLLFEVTTQ